MKTVLSDTPDTRLDFLDGFRFMGIIMVIGFHANAYVVLSPEHRSAIIALMSTIAVPIFFLADGFLFARKQNRTTLFSYAGYIQKSARRLLLPWLIFSLIYLGARYAFEITGVLEQRMVVGQPAARVLLKVYTSTIAPQMYFLLSLFLIRMLSPVNRRIARAPDHVVLLVFCLYAIGYRLVDVSAFFFEGQDPVLHALWGFQFHLLGVVLFKYWPSIQPHAAVAAAAGVIIAVLARRYAPFQLSGLYQYGCLAAAFFAFAAGFNTKNLFARCGQLTMGIYLIHTPVLMKGLQMAIHMMGWRDLPAYGLILGANLLISIGLTRVMTLFPLGQVFLGEDSKRPD